MRHVLWGLAMTAGLACRADGSGTGASWATARLIEDAKEAWSPEVGGVRVRLGDLQRERNDTVRCEVLVQFPGRGGALPRRYPEVLFYDSAGRCLGGVGGLVFPIPIANKNSARTYFSFSLMMPPPGAAFATARIGRVVTPRVRIRGPGSR